MTGANPRPGNATLTPYLSRRETEVVALIAEGLTNREIALALGLAEATVKSHVKHGLRRLGCRSRSEMVHVAWKRGLLPVNDDWVEAHLSRLWTLLSEQEQRR